MMAVLSREDLTRVGLKLDPTAFQELVADAVRAMPAAETAGSALHDLTAAESAVLEAGGFDLRPERPDESADDPLVRGAAEYAALLATALTPPQVAQRLGLDVSRIRHRLAERTLYGVKTPAGWRLPLFQFDPSTGGVLPGLATVLTTLDPETHPVAIQRWFLHPDPDLEREGRSMSPRDWLLHGGAPTAVVPLAAAV
jgi:hypothetical protein